MAARDLPLSLFSVPGFVVQDKFQLGRQLTKTH